MNKLYSLILLVCFFQSINGLYSNGSLILLQVGNQTHKYYMPEVNATYFEASSFCYMYGMDLVSFQNEAESTAVLNYINTLPGYRPYFFTSAHKLGRNQWAWIDGSPILFAAWATDQPNDPVNSHCILLEKNAGWNDALCSDKYNFICETR